MKVEIRKINALRAAQILKKSNKQNRKLNQMTVRTYAADMLQGRWMQSSGDTIKFDVNGQLRDGQHRLAAVIEAEVDINFIVVTELDPDVIHVLDTGRGRSAGDLLKIKGVKQANNVSTAVRRFLTASLNGPSKKALKGGKHGARITNTMIWREYSNRPDFYQDIVHKLIQFYEDFNRVITPGFMASYYIIALDKYPKSKVEEFWKILIYGNAEPDNPAIQLRNLFLKDAIRDGSNMTQAAKDQLMTRAFNLYMTDRRVNKLKYNEEDGVIPLVDPDVVSRPIRQAISEPIKTDHRVTA